MSAVFDTLALIWGFFSIDHPLLGISFADIFIGAFVINFSIGLLKPLLGLGGSSLKGIHISKRASASKGNHISNRRKPNGTSRTRDT